MRISFFFVSGNACNSWSILTRHCSSKLPILRLRWIYCLAVDLLFHWYVKIFLQFSRWFWNWRFSHARRLSLVTLHLSKLGSVSALSFSRCLESSWPRQVFPGRISSSFLGEGGGLSELSRFFHLSIWSFSADLVHRRKHILSEFQYLLLVCILTVLWVARVCCLFGSFGVHCYLSPYVWRGYSACTVVRIFYEVTSNFGESKCIKWSLDRLIKGPLAWRISTRSWLMHIAVPKNLISLFVSIPEDDIDAVGHMDTRDCGVQNDELMLSPNSILDVRSWAHRIQVTRSIVRKTTRMGLISSRSIVITTRVRLR